jgi:Na+/proline symporter
MQRAFATDSAKSARRAMLTGGWISLPASLIFYATGSALFAYYHSHPEQLRPTLQTDSILPLFIVQHVPAGVAGLVIAGIFATGMNTLSASMNMVATVVVRDWYAFFNRQAKDSTRMRTARLITFATGVLGTSMACWLAYLQIGSVWDTFSKLMGWLGGGFGCVGLLGMLTRRASTLGTLVGVIVSTLALIWVSLYTNLSFFAWGTFTLLVGCIVGYLASLVLPDRPRNLDGLTVWTPHPQQVTQ